MRLVAELPGRGVCGRRPGEIERRGKSPDVCQDRGSAAVRPGDFSLLVPLSLSAMIGSGPSCLCTFCKPGSGVVHLGEKSVENPIDWKG